MGHRLFRETKTFWCVTCSAETFRQHFHIYFHFKTSVLTVFTKVGVVLPTIWAWLFEVEGSVVTKLLSIGVEILFIYFLILVKFKSNFTSKFSF